MELSALLKKEGVHLPVAQFLSVEVESIPIFLISPPGWGVKLLHTAW